MGPWYFGKGVALTALPFTLQDVEVAGKEAQGAVEPLRLSRERAAKVDDAVAIDSPRDVRTSPSAARIGPRK